MDQIEPKMPHAKGNPIWLFLKDNTKVFYGKSHDERLRIFQCMRKKYPM